MREPTQLPSSYAGPRKKAQPRGLWKARVTRQPTSREQKRHQRQHSDSDHDGDELESVSSNSSKRRRTESEQPSEDEQGQIYYWDYSGQSIPRHPPPTMDTSSVVSGSRLSENFDLQDWENLKDLFNQAAEVYESGRRFSVVARVGLCL
jgi:hypothetical protein